MTSNCTKCGKLLMETDVYCSFCGTRKENSDNIRNGDAIQIQSDTMKRYYNPVTIKIGVLAVVFIALLIYFNALSTPQKTINKFEKYYNEQNTDGMIECLEPKVQSVFKGTLSIISGISGQSANTICESVLEFLDSNTSKTLSQMDLKVKDVDYISKTSARVKVQYSYNNGESNVISTGTLQMVKVNGRWYISVTDSMYNYFK